MKFSTVEQGSDLDAKRPVLNNKNSKKLNLDLNNVTFEVIDTTKEATTEHSEGFIDEIEENNPSNKMVNTQIGFQIPSRQDRQNIVANMRLLQEKMNL